jgi:hypothetical protein
MLTKIQFPSEQPSFTKSRAFGRLRGHRMIVTENVRAGLVTFTVQHKTRQLDLLARIMEEAGIRNYVIKEF